MDAMIARQPVLDREQKLFGYELLFRDGPSEFLQSTAMDRATGAVISDAVHIHGLTRLTEGKKCFVNFNRQSLRDELHAMLPAETTVVEILETVEPDDALTESCVRIREAGFTLALDDYVPESRLSVLLPHVQMLKVEFPVLSASQHDTVLRSAAEHGLQLLAEKVESPEQFQRALDLGYHLFQGFYFCRPQTVQSKRLPTSKLQIMRLLHLVNQPTFQIDRIEQLIRQDVSLSYRLLRFLNSAIFKLQSRVESVRHAIAMLGQRPMQRWGSLLCLGEMGKEKPPELLKTCLIRARFCELTGEKVLSRDEAEECFMVGMFSLLDALLDRPLDSVVRELALSPMARSGLLRSDSPMRPLLELLVAVESADWPGISNLSASLGIDESTALDLYATSVTWTGEILQHSS